MKENQKWAYADILDLPHHQSKRHPHMSNQERAAQFSAFAALTGYEDAVDEAARLTDAKIEPDESGIDLLNAEMQILQDHIAETPEITVTYFLPDEKKAGGRYVALSGRVSRIDDCRRVLRFTDGKTVPMDDIFSMDGEIFDALFQSGAEEV